MAKTTELLLLEPLRMALSNSRPPSRSSQSTTMASNFSEEMISFPERAPRHTSTSMDNVSNVRLSTRITSASRLRTSDSSCMATDRSPVFIDTKVTDVIIQHFFYLIVISGCRRPCKQHPYRRHQA